jgi:vancomycin resistance protein YoaR
MFTKSKILLIILFTPLIAYLLFEIIYFNAAYPNTYIGNQNISHKNRTQLQSLLEQEFKNRENQTLIFNLNTGKPVTITLNNNLLSYDTTKTVDHILNHGRSGPILEQIKQKIGSLVQKQTIKPVYDFDTLTFDTLLADQLRPFEKPVLETKLVSTSTGLALTPSKPGVVVNRDLALENVHKYLDLESTEPIFQIILENKNPQVTRENSKKVLEQAIKATSHSITLKSEKIADKAWTIEAPDLFEFLEVTYDTNLNEPVLTIPDYKVASFSAEFEPLVSKEPVEAKIQTVGNQTVVLEASQDGYNLDSEKLTQQIRQIAFSGNTAATIELPIKTISPAITQNKVNEQGIKELIASGKSDYKGSYQGRIHNIEAAVEKLNGAVIKTGQTFSMYQIIGDIEKSTGFVDSAIIKNGRTVTGVGGGVCQVSTTLFRAALNAGFPITDRDAHSYRVKYYELDSPPGLDAAIYFPGQDFKFVNNTQGNVLIQIQLDKENQTMTTNFYGVKDNRVVNVSDPKITNQINPPAEVRIPDENIPKGIIRQTEFAAVGARVEINRTVTRDGQVIVNDTYRSVYRPWQAVYLIGTKLN